MKSQGEIEAAVCAGIARFEQDYMGRGPKDIHAYLIGDLLVVRLKGVLTVAEQQLVTSLPAEKGRDLLKQVRIHLVETAGHGGHDSGGHGHQSREPAPRHQHRHRRRGGIVYAGEVAALPRGQKLGISSTLKPVFVCSGSRIIERYAF
jgi:Na+-translocating membrane potential-generating system (MpsC)